MSYIGLICKIKRLYLFFFTPHVPIVRPFSVTTAHWNMVLMFLCFSGNIIHSALPSWLQKPPWSVIAVGSPYIGFLWSSAFVVTAAHEQSIWWHGSETFFSDCTWLKIYRQASKRWKWADWEPLKQSWTAGNALDASFLWFCHCVVQVEAERSDECVLW